MSFSADWLALRAPFDAAARNRSLEHRLAAWADGRALRIVDLGAGSGNNRAHLAPMLPAGQTWTLVDGDADLLSRAAAPGVQIVEADLGGDLDRLIPAGVDLVTASALIDLVSRDWLRRLCRRVEAVGAALLVVLSYDGRILWDSEDARDRLVQRLVNRHQQGDKGLGPALGPDAAPALAGLLPGVADTPSDWVIEPRESAMRAALVDGWASAAAEVAPELADEIASWQDDARTAPRRLVVGHRDQLWLPPA